MQCPSTASTAWRIDPLLSLALALRRRSDRSFAFPMLRLSKHGQAFPKQNSVSQSSALALQTVAHPLRFGAHPCYAAAKMITAYPLRIRCKQSLRIAILCHAHAESCVACLSPCIACLCPRAGLHCRALPPRIAAIPGLSNAPVFIATLFPRKSLLHPAYPMRRRA